MFPFSLVSWHKVDNPYTRQKKLLGFGVRSFDLICYPDPFTLHPIVTDQPTDTTSTRKEVDALLQTKKTP